jgi:hypothetical protein
MEFVVFFLLRSMEGGGITALFLTSALGGVKWSASHSGCVAPFDERFRGPQKRSIRIRCEGKENPCPSLLETLLSITRRYTG